MRDGEGPGEDDPIKFEPAVLSEAERTVVEQARTVYEFDDGFIARRHGYASADAYYAQNAAIGFLDRIDRPTLEIGRAHV